MNAYQERVRAAYLEFERADLQWSTDLQSTFGKHAGDVRYTALGRTHPDCKDSYERFRKANDAWLEAIRLEREAHP